jgi:hypothetical protein
MSFKITSGRKRDSTVWQHFSHDAVPNKSKCLVSTADGKQCGRMIAGKNTTNLMNHLKFNHASVHKEVVDAESAKKLAATTSKNDESSPAMPNSSMQQQSLSSCLRKPSVWARDSHEAKCRDQQLAKMIVSSGIQVRIVENQQFVEFCKILDPKYCVPGRTKINRQLKDNYEDCRSQVMAALSSTRRLTIGMDIWTKKGYSCSYLAISAALFHQKLREPIHIILNLDTIQHPHTGEMIGERLTSTLDAWNIDRRKVLRIITDNGSNMVKAIKKLSEDSAANRPALDVDDENNADDSDSDLSPDEIDFTMVDNVFTFKRFSCLAHCIQLVVRSLDKVPSFINVLTKARSVVSTIRVSSVATQKLISLSGKTVIPDCPTRWSSSFLLVSRLLELKPAIDQIFQEMRWDTLALSEWTKLEDLSKLLQPFATHTDQLQSDNLAMPYVIPTIRDLQCHLDESCHNALMASTLRRSVDSRFSKYLNPTDLEFDPLPAIACLLSPDVAKVMLTEDMEQLLIAAKKHIPVMVRNTVHMPPAASEESSAETAEVDSDGQPPLKKFKYLSQKISATLTHEQSTLDSTSNLKMEIGRYIAECRMQQYDDKDVLDFWMTREKV